MTVERRNLPPEEQKSLPRYPLPVALLGRLAVAQSAQGRGIGPRLLRDALRRVLETSTSVGCLGVIVDAKDESAEGFYLNFGFTPLPLEAGTPPWPRRLFIALETVRDALAVEDRDAFMA